MLIKHDVSSETAVFSSREKADTVSDGITSSPSSHHLRPTPTNVVCSLVALLALLASILLKISSPFRFHEIPFCKFECFPCNFSRDHSALKEKLIHTHGNISILASKDKSLESGLNSWMRGTTVHWNKQMRFLIPSENLSKNRLCFSNVDR